MTQPKIFFIGPLSSSFIRQDWNVLSELADVAVFDLSSLYLSKKNFPHYIRGVFQNIAPFLRSDILWIWFPDFQMLPFVILAKITGKPIVTRIGGWEVSAEHEIGYGAQLKRIRGAIIRWIISVATMNVVMSPSYAHKTLNACPTSHVVVVPGFVDDSLLMTTLPKKHGVVMSFNTYRNGVPILKGMNTFVEATMGMENALVVDVPQPEVFASLLQAKVYCQLSYTESFGMTVLEAMALGCIPVVTDRDALPWLVKDYGYIVKWGDVKGTREAILAAMQDTEKHPRERAMKFNREEYIEGIKRVIRICMSK